MTAITVTPEMVRVVFLRRTGRSLGLSFGFRAVIISAFESMRLSWWLAATWVLTRCTSSRVGCGKSSRAFMTSRDGLSAFKIGIPY